MIPVSPRGEPADFDRDCRQKGRQWIGAHPDIKRPKDFWTPFRQVLTEGFAGRCAYAAMFEPVGTVDHFLSCANHPDQAYEWGNYRYASDLINKIKGTADATILDPFEVQHGWFEILLPSLQMRVSERVPAEFRDKAEFTLQRLRLRDDERVIRWRRAWYALYQQGELTLDGLRTMAPLIAEAVDRDTCP